MTKTKSMTPVYIFGILLILAVAACTVVSLLLMKTVNSQNSEIASLLEKYEDTQTTGDPMEDDVTIAGSYVIRSTTLISDAYKSGDTSGLSDMDKETLNMATDVLDSIITDGMSDYEKELAVYDWMTSELSSDQGLLTAIPTTQQYCDRPYGVLKYHNAVCVGYATTFRLFMQMMDIECMVVHNTELYHSWDLVKIDGSWYHTDIYSDAGTGAYSNFNMDDAMCAASHDWDTTYFPAATSLALNYSYQHRIVLKDIYSIAAELKSAIDSKSSSVTFGFEDAIDDTGYAIAEQLLTQVSDYLSYSGQYSSAYMSWAWNQGTADGEFIVTITLSGLDSGSTSSLTDEQLQKINDAVTAVFGSWESGYYNGYAG